MISINNLSYYIGDRPIFDEASLHIKPKDKIGLIGLNGTGKTTLLRIINREITPDGGDVAMPKDTTIGYLNQDLLSYQSDESILAVAMEAFQDAVKIEIRMEKVLRQMETEYSDALMMELANLQEKYEALGGYSLQAKAEEILEGIGFTTADLHRPLKEFSGGWRMRVMLARLLLEKPSLLMLDEPTNHLDLPSIQWVEQYLKSYEGAVIVVSHDRKFLDNTVGRIAEVNDCQIDIYEGNYSFFLEEKELRLEIQKGAYENQQQKIRQTERFIERFRAKATKARQVQSRVKQLERMERVEQVIDHNAVINFKFEFGQASGRHVIRMEDVDKSYGDVKVFEKSSGYIERGDKIALIGANGKGKSTLLRIIAGTENIEGKVERGYNLVQAFYAQHQIEALNIENDIITELKQAGSQKTEQELRGLLGCFLFHGDDVFKKIKVLSGGEKSRVALAKTLISQANFLLLDEPTNHLDMQSVNILIQALEKYQGSFLVVSHDRFFIEHIANKIWYIEDHQLKEYPGDYAEYEYWTQSVKAEQVAEEVEVKVKPAPPIKVVQDTEDKEAKRRKKQLQQKIQDIEDQIAGLEAQKINLEEQLASPAVYSNPDTLFEVNQAYESIKDHLEQLNEDWLKLAEEDF